MELDFPIYFTDICMHVSIMCFNYLFIHHHIPTQLVLFMKLTMKKKLFLCISISVTEVECVIQHIYYKRNEYNFFVSLFNCKGHILMTRNIYPTYFEEW